MSRFFIAMFMLLPAAQASDDFRCWAFCGQNYKSKKDIQARGKTRGEALEAMLAQCEKPRIPFTTITAHKIEYGRNKKGFGAKIHTQRLVYGFDVRRACFKKGDPFYF